MIRIRRPSAKANCILAAKFYRGNRLDNDVCLWAQRSSFEGDGLPQHPRRLVAAARLRLSALLGPRFEPGRVRPHTHIQQIQKRTRWGSSFVFGGGGGIRTHGTEDRTLDFESSPFDHSGTSPTLVNHFRALPTSPDRYRGSFDSMSVFVNSIAALSHR